MRRLAAVVLLYTVLCGCRAATTPPAAPPNILLVTIDTWRADRLQPSLTPNLSALAASGATFTNARAAAPLTLPSHTTLLTGLLPPAHGVRENGNVLNETHTTIARLLKDRGYQTAAFIGAFVLDRRFGLGRGFDVYDDKIPRDPNATEKLEAERPAAAVIDAALTWFASQHPAAPGTQHQHPAPSTQHQHPAPSTQHPAPFFIWIHLYDPHAPYVVREPRATSDEQRYDSEVGYADAQLARLLTRLREQSQLANTVILAAGDHGEGLGEHGERTHGMLLYDSTLRVPLLVAGPGVQQQKRDEPVSLVDVGPTILAIAGVTAPDVMKGRSLLGSSGSRRGTGSTEPEVYAETEYPRVAGWSPLQALTDGRWKTIRASRETELYDLKNDAREQNNLASTQESTATAMATRIDAIHASGASSTSQAVSAEAQERLRALGYVASSARPASGSNAPNPAANVSDWNAFEDALSRLNRHDHVAVRAALNQLATRHPNALVFQTTLATALRESGKPADALAIYRAAASRWPTDATLLHDLAVAAREAGRLDEAIQADQAALALEPGSPTARNGLGLLAIDQGRNQDAVHQFTEATQTDPNNASYWTNLGNAKRAIGDRGGAEQAYRKGLGIDATSPDAANGLGVLLVEANRPSEAVDWFRRAVEARPGFVEAELNYAIALQQSGARQRAIEVYRSLLANPGNYPREKQAARELLAALGAGR
jgi:choline-sulfatase